ncbi:hypothetical protein TWF481_003095 [Arthrobotrys musiformis]|uniref:HNH nuclease domain-containing protein n=1 Tax=Arthrobotrys musiformis TaxID=47236 RepID=A0AAV9VPI5_9PEZI
MDLWDCHTGDERINNLPWWLSMILPNTLWSESDLDRLTRQITARDKCKCLISDRFYYRSYEFNPRRDMSAETWYLEDNGEAVFSPSDYTKKHGVLEHTVTPILPVYQYIGFTTEGDYTLPLQGRYEAVLDFLKDHFPAVADYLMFKFNETDFLSPKNLLSLWTAATPLDKYFFEGLEFWLDYETTISTLEAVVLQKRDPSVRFYANFIPPHNQSDDSMPPPRAPNYDVYRLARSLWSNFTNRTLETEHGLFWKPGRVMIPQTELSPSRAFLAVHAVMCKISIMLDTGFKIPLDELVSMDNSGDQVIDVEMDDPGDMMAAGSEQGGELEDEEDDGIGEDDYSGLELEFSQWTSELEYAVRTLGIEDEAPSVTGG